MFFDSNVNFEIDLDLNAHVDEILDQLSLEGGEDAIRILERNDHLGVDDLVLIRNYCEKQLHEILRNQVSGEIYYANRELRDRMDAIEKQLREQSGTI